MASSDGSNRIYAHSSLMPLVSHGSPSSYPVPVHTPELSAHKDNQKNIQYGFLRMADLNGWTARHTLRPGSYSRL